MTEKIIIDGVDVSKCCWCDFEPNTEPYCRINDGEDLDCEDNPDCNFKKLKRAEQKLQDKEQECEEFGETLDEIEKLAKENVELLEGYHLEQANCLTILEIINQAKEYKTMNNNEQNQKEKKFIYGEKVME